ncbi:hypothetical protein [Amycolatopsis echigonensis]|uniref:Uncharacterized protein n=1 Tax=Amycolatopsis echigonensis TaxID=2576905 RepID=A0A2N3WQP7_9PSEU|nr:MULTISPECIES: hypothetical protein [Amycolatopsis]MBB2500269.1 hypothetical protein [Amycolatopsis echigonensis]PKV96175.1 hypothetical protein ATK30_7112 [Amycolatopsis niigatensis]
MRGYRNYWTYSAGLLVAWALVLLFVGLFRGGHEVAIVLPVFGGFCIGWVSTTIARYVYPPPKQWLS